MQLDLKARGFSLTPALNAATRRQARRLANRLGDRLVRLQVRLFDVNGCRGGLDKGCLVAASIGGRRTAVASSFDSDLYRAIPEAFDKLLGAVVAATRREHALRRPRARRLPSNA